MYGYEITQKVKELTAGDVQLNEGALYPALHKLEAEGCLTVEIEHAGKRLRKYYSITPKGKTESVSRLAELQEFLERMQLIVNAKLDLQ